MNALFDDRPNSGDVLDFYHKYFSVERFLRDSIFQNSYYGELDKPPYMPVVICNLLNYELVHNFESNTYEFRQIQLKWGDKKTRDKFSQNNWKELLTPSEWLYLLCDIYFKNMMEKQGGWRIPAMEVIMYENLAFEQVKIEVRMRRGYHGGEEGSMVWLDYYLEGQLKKVDHMSYKDYCKFRKNLWNVRIPEDPADDCMFYYNMDMQIKNMLKGKKV